MEDMLFAVSEGKGLEDQRRLKRGDGCLGEMLSRASVKEVGT
jgi:hypothetical protein